MEKKRESFSGSLGFILTAAGSAVGLGNIWRFPYLAAKNGGGVFLISYLVLVLTFGFTLLVTEIAIGRKTKRSPVSAYGEVHPKWKWVGGLTVMIPFLILSYYGVVGGWVLKYCTVYLTGQGSSATGDYFSNYIAQPVQPVIFMAIYTLITAFVVYRGINKGIEKLSKIMMPILLVVIVGISIFVLTISRTNSAGETVTGIDGLVAYIVPDVSDLTVSGLMHVLLDAMGQMFFSISVASGIMIAYGSYCGDDNDLTKSVGLIEICDTFVAFMAGVMVIVPLFVVLGRDGMNASGPTLLFVAMPGVFAYMGIGGMILGGAFFIMIFFAAITSSVSMMEAVVSSLIEKFGMARNKAVFIQTGLILVLGIAVCMGYNILYFDITLPNGGSGQILDVLDYLSNNIMMPLVAIATCILIGWIVKPKYVIEESTKNGEKFRRQGLYVIMVRFVAPIFLIVLFLQSLGIIK